LKPISENQKMHKGLEYVIRRMTFSMHLAPLLLKENWKHDDEFLSLRDDMSSSIQSLYQNMLQYEMNCVKTCHCRWNVIQNLVSRNGWEKQLQAIQEAQKGVDGYMEKYNTETIKEYLRTSAALYLMWERRGERPSDISANSTTISTTSWGVSVRVGPVKWGSTRTKRKRIGPGRAMSRIDAHKKSKSARRRRNI
jgi:hypothetical protein